MPEISKQIKPPHGITRWALRLPIVLYRVGLGWLLGRRFVLLTHTGRKSGALRQNVLEVVRYNPDNGECIIASGWGYQSDWIKNILADPQITFQVGNRQEQGIARQLTPDEGADELLSYSRLHPAAFREIMHFLGYKMDGTESDIRVVGQMLPMFLLSPDHEYN